ncbi:catabolite gene activator protein [Spirochaetia bacterium]|nr:catabolite gene activator protein [Spirochaetia bacterium]
MPKPFQYRAGSLIYFKGDLADKVFILQTGKVNLTYQDIETGEDVRDPVQPGEFFGVKSALGRYAREENAIAMQDTTVMAFTVPEFEALCMANTRIVMKMLKVFSNQMRRIHKQVSSLMEKEEQNPDVGLFNVGEYYLKNKRFSQAKYVFSRYLTYYPAGKNAAAAARNLEQAELSLIRYGNGNASASGKGAAPRPAQPAAASQPPGDLSETARAYYDAVGFISQGKYSQAYLAFQRIVDTDEDPEYTAKSFYEIGRCLYYLNKYDECIKHYTVMITRYPKHPDLRDAIFYIGQSYEKNGRRDQAAAFYKKILSMTTGDDDGPSIKAKKALKALEG